MNHVEQKTVRIPYPRISFRKAYSYLARIKYEHPTNNALTKDQITQALGFTPSSGTANSALGALSHYGFARKTGVQNKLRYNLTELAHKLTNTQNSPDWASAALRSVTQPEVFNFLYSHYEHGSLPNDIKTQLINKYSQVNAKNASKIIKLFYDSMNFISEGLPAKAPAAPLVEKQYELSLGEGLILSVSEEVVIEAVKHYLKNFKLD